MAVAALMVTEHTHAFASTALLATTVTDVSSVGPPGCIYTYHVFSSVSYDDTMILSSGMWSILRKGCCTSSILYI